MLKAFRDKVAVIATEVMEENRELILFPQLKIALGVCCTSIVTCHVIMIPHLDTTIIYISFLIMQTIHCMHIIRREKIEINCEKIK